MYRKKGRAFFRAELAITHFFLYLAKYIMKRFIKKVIYM